MRLILALAACAAAPAPLTMTLPAGTSVFEVPLSEVHQEFLHRGNWVDVLHDPTDTKSLLQRVFVLDTHPHGDTWHATLLTTPEVHKTLTSVPRETLVLSLRTECFGPELWPDGIDGEAVLAAPGPIRWCGEQADQHGNPCE